MKGYTQAIALVIQFLFFISICVLKIIPEDDTEGREVLPLISPPSFSQATCLCLDTQTETNGPCDSFLVIKQFRNKIQEPQNI